MMQYTSLLFLGWLLLPLELLAQTTADTSSSHFTLEQCIAYALKNRPAVRQASIDEEIGEHEIKTELSAWLPQIGAQFQATHNFKLQTAAFGDNLVTIGRKNNSNMLLQAEQLLYGRDVVLASQAARFVRLQLDQSTKNQKINTVVDVTKAFYDILLTLEQLKILDENIARQEKQYQDALSQYQQGIVDKTDYQRAGITLANTRSDRNRVQKSVDAKYALLKGLMGYEAEAALQLDYNYELMEQDIQLDTTLALTYSDRVEYRQLSTRQQLLKLNTSYHRWGFLPTVSAFANYNWIYLSDTFSDLYQTAYPTSLAGIRIALPVFQGNRRLQQLQIAQLQEERLQAEEEQLKNSINIEYERALASYQSDYQEWLTLKENIEVAEEVYQIIKLQYDEGIKAYLELIVAETELRTAQINYYNALYNVLSSKLDYQKALGNIDIH